MLNIVKYPIIIKYWVNYFLNKDQLLPIFININFYKLKIHINIGLYIKQPSNKNLSNFFYNLAHNLKLKLFCVKLQQSLQHLFKNKFKIFIFNSLKFLNTTQRLQSTHMFKYTSKIRLPKVRLKDFINVFSISLFFKVPLLLLNYLSFIFSKAKKHSNLVFILKKIFTEFFRLLPNLKGIRLFIKGKLNGVTRTKLVILKKGKLSLTTKAPNIIYAQNSSTTFTGTFGFKLWFNYFS